LIERVEGVYKASTGLMTSEITTKPGLEGQVGRFDNINNSGIKTW